MVNFVQEIPPTLLKNKRLIYNEDQNSLKETALILPRKRENISCFKVYIFLTFVTDFVTA